MAIGSFQIILLRRLHCLAILFVLSASLMVAQSIYLPVSHEVYPFLKRMEARGFLRQYRDAAKPLSRLEIARHFVLLEGHILEMTEVERNTYEYLKGEFNYELDIVLGSSEPSETRGHLMFMYLQNGILNLDFNGQLEQRNIGSKQVRLRSQGFKLYGYATDDIGYYLNFVDNREVGGALNPTKSNTPDPGIVSTKRETEVLEYNTIEAQVTLALGQFQLSLEKMQNVWGSGRNGNIIFSTKTPSYPQFKLRFPITDWMDFIYLHADLNSAMIDSGRSYISGSSSMAEYYRPVDRLKFIAAHQLEISVMDGLDLSLGESVVYSDRGPLLIYMIPIMFFKSAEHYNNDKDNIQWFFNADVNLIPDVNCYATLLLDDLSTDNLLGSSKANNEVAYTIGFQAYDVLKDNLEITCEYTRLNPWVYHHKFSATNVSSNGYDLGHWIGQNADNVFLELSYRPSRVWQFGSSYERFRKGGEKDIAYHYQNDLTAPQFLFGPLRDEESFCLYGRYQFLRDGFITLSAKSREVKDEAGLDPLLGSQMEYRLNIRYGIW
ncbi:MAG: hypothetical protein V1799_18025 [bacterium]